MKNGGTLPFFCDYLPLLLFNYYLLTQYVLLLVLLKKDINYRHKKMESSQTPNLH